MKFTVMSVFYRKSIINTVSPHSVVVVVVVVVAGGGGAIITVAVVVVVVFLFLLLPISHGILPMSTERGWYYLYKPALLDKGLSDV